MQERLRATRPILTVLLAGLLTTTGAAWAGSTTQGKASTQATMQLAAGEDDATLGTKIKAALQGDPMLASLPIQVAVKSGMVTLSGEVATDNDRKHAAEVVSLLEGVKSIKNDLKVKS